MYTAEINGNNIRQSEMYVTELDQGLDYVTLKATLLSKFLLVTKNIYIVLLSSARRFVVWQQLIDSIKA